MTKYELTSKIHGDLAKIDTLVFIAKARRAKLVRALEQAWELPDMPGVDFDLPDMPEEV